MDAYYLGKALLPMCHPKKGKLLIKEDMSKPNFNNPKEKITLNLKFKTANIKCPLAPAGIMQDKPEPGAKEDPAVLY